MTIEQLKAGITSLPKGEFAKFRNWFLELYNELWDIQMQEDTEAGRLDFLIDQVDRKIAAGEIYEIIFDEDGSMKKGPRVGASKAR